MCCRRWCELKGELQARCCVSHTHGAEFRVGIDNAVVRTDAELVKVRVVIAILVHALLPALRTERGARASLERGAVVHLRSHALHIRIGSLRIGSIRIGKRRSQIALIETAVTLRRDQASGADPEDAAPWGSRGTGARGYAEAARWPEAQPAVRELEQMHPSI